MVAITAFREGDSLRLPPSRLAGDAAARSPDSRRAKILSILAERGPLALWEISALFGVHVHQISGRITDLARDLLD